SLLPVAKDGSLQPYVQLVQHEGTGANKERQEKAHVHATVLSPDQRYVYVPDLGMDKVMAYRFQPAAEKPLQPAQPVFVRSEPGSGPRHFTFHPNGKWAYLVEELTGTVVAYRYANGKLTSLDRKATHPNTYTGAKGSADIHVSPDGRFLYASNRGDANTLAIFAIDSRTGKLTLKGYQPTLGVHPRNFAIDPSGNFLLVANRDSNAIVVFRRNPKTGLLRATGKTIEVPSPVCLKLFR
ncbi:MAG TPA: lactonase family protein, partial [Chitinophagaceae bacterium]|nr:lactonase family protein [Chitinophagaceae bacterium]